MLHIVYGLFAIGLRGLNEGTLGNEGLGNEGLFNQSLGNVGGRFSKSLGGRGSPVTAKWIISRTRLGACLHHGTISGFKIDLGSSAGNGHTIPSIKTIDATIVTRHSLVKLKPLAISWKIKINGFEIF